jgi:type IV pilus assembly protein PilN
MIRINLLPLRAERKKEETRQLVSTYILVMTCVLLILAWVQISRMRQISHLDAQLQTNRSEIDRYKLLADQLKKLQAQRAAIEAKLNVINSLEKSKAGPVHLLDELASRIPAQRLWLTSLDQNAANLTLKGEAMDNESIAIYMRQLGGSPYVKGVDLVSAEQKDHGGVKVMEFIVTCQLSMPGAPEPAPATAPATAPGGKPGGPVPPAAPGQKVALR